MTIIRTAKEMRKPNKLSCPIDMPIQTIHTAAMIAKNKNVHLI